MIQFKSISDLSKLPSDDPAHPIIEGLAQRLLVTDESTAYPYDPEADGWIVLIEPEDIDRPLTEIWGDDAYSLIQTPFEGVTLEKGMFVAVFLANNRFGLVFIIPDEPWLPNKLRNVLEDNLVPAPDTSTNQP
jgi:hypothetical protein